MDYLKFIEDLQAGTAGLKAIYDALIQQGFTENQAMVLLCAFINKAGGE